MLRRMLCNALIQQHFYACSAWYNNLNINLSKKLQITQNKCTRFCLGLDNRTHIGVNEFKSINWLPLQNRYEQCVSVSAFKLCKGLGPAYMSDIYFLVENPRTTRRWEYKIKLTNIGQSGILNIGPKV